MVEWFFKKISRREFIRFVVLGAIVLGMYIFIKPFLFLDKETNLKTNIIDESYATSIGNNDTLLPLMSKLKVGSLSPAPLESCNSSSKPLSNIFDDAIH